VDKKNTFIGAGLFIAAFAVLIYSNKYAPKHPAPAEIQHEVSRQIAKETPAEAAAGAAEVQSSTAEPTFTAAEADQSTATVTKLGNSFVEVNFTDAGGSIRDVAFKKYPATQGQPNPFIFNELHASPMLAFVGLPGLDRSTRYDLVSKSSTEVVYRAVLDKKIEVTRRYVVSPDRVGSTDPYVIRCETTLRNLADSASVPMRVALS
jgi:YidC/Oxa1 family membrane protein insertase